MRNATTTGATRREFLVRSAATAGGAFLSIGLPALLPGSRAEAATTAAMSSFTPSIWFTLTPDGKVTMHIVKAEMGQHIGTSLAQVIAEELAIRWQDVHLDTPLESVENFAIYGLAYTVNSGSVTTEFDRLSRAGAAGRMALIEAGAKLLGATPDGCHAENGRVVDPASGRSIGYGEIIRTVKIDRKFAYPNDFNDIKLKEPVNYTIVGQSLPALDIPAKTSGQAKYGIDVFLPNMVYGAVAVPRTRCRSPIEMSPVSPIEMSLRQAVVETFGVTCDDGDPNERSGTDPASYHDRLGRRPDHSRGYRGVDGSGPAPGFPAASCVRC
jgi:isoquinoline 1-oxidoreductase subunit beta